MFFMGESEKVVEGWPKIMRGLLELVEKRNDSATDAFLLELIFPGSESLVAKNARHCLSETL